jgi:3-oxoadipate enol-lactonase/4-carboxymuconolactone decarboxylase
VRLGDAAHAAHFSIGSARSSRGLLDSALLRDLVGAAIEGTTDFTADFQDLITRFAWRIWARPGLDRRMRSAITITALVAGGRFDELPMHIRAARRNGLSDDEIKEVLLQCAIYCGVPAANTAFRFASRELDEC